MNAAHLNAAHLNAAHLNAAHLNAAHLNEALNYGVLINTFSLVKTRIKKKINTKFLLIFSLPKRRLQQQTYKFRKFDMSCKNKVVSKRGVAERPE